MNNRGYPLHSLLGLTRARVLRRILCSTYYSTVGSRAIPLIPRRLRHRLI